MVLTSAAETYSNKIQKEKREKLALLSKTMLTKKNKVKNSPVLCLEMTDITLDWGKGHSKGWTGCMGVREGRRLSARGATRGGGC